MTSLVLTLALMLHAGVPVSHESKRIDDESWEFSSRLAKEEESCGIGDVVFRVVEVEPEYQLDSKLIIEHGDTSHAREIPRSRFVSNVWASSPLACDVEAGRVFVASSIRGIIQAYSIYGDLVWDLELPGFSSAHDDPSVPSRGAPMVLMNTLAEKHSIVLTLDLVGEHVVAQYVTARQWYTQVVIHRSGAIAYTIGPWPGVIEGVDGDRLLLVTDFEVKPSPGIVKPQHPRELVTVPVSSKEAALVEHFLAWLLPLPGNGEGYGWRQCEALPRSTIARRMGAGYDAKSAGEAKRRHDAMGVAWFNEITNRGHMPDIIRTAQPLDPDWVNRLRVELLRVGADADFWRRPTRPVT